MSLMRKLFSLCPVGQYGCTDTYSLICTLHFLRSTCHLKLHNRISSLAHYNSVTDLLKALLGNSSVNTYQHTRQYGGSIFLCPSMDRCYATRVLRRHTTVSSDHVTCVFSSWSVPRGYKGQW
jgi:hypothetical protein